MGNILPWPMIIFFQRLSMVLTLASCVYIAFFIAFKFQENPVIFNNSAPIGQRPILNEPSTVLDLKPYNPSIGQERDVFSLASEAPSGTIINTPKGQLPNNLKVVGILIGHPSQIIIEDSLSNKTYFINEGNVQAGIRIEQVSVDKMIINYQGQDIPIPITKN